MEVCMPLFAACIVGYVFYTYVFNKRKPLTPKPAKPAESHQIQKAPGERNQPMTFEQDLALLGMGDLFQEPALAAFNGFQAGHLEKYSEGPHSHHGGQREASSLFIVPGSTHALQEIREGLRNWAFEQLYAERRRIALQAQCLQDFPEMLDIVTLGLSAGLSFDASINLYTARYHSFLAYLLNYGMTIWKLGFSDRVSALEHLSLHLEMGAFTRFSMAVSEALEFGIPLADALSRQAKEIRREQRLQVEEGIEKIPVKMLIPMGVFVVPAMLLAILGPLLSSAMTGG